MLKKTKALLLSASLLMTGASALAASPGLYVGGQLGYNDITVGSLSPSYFKTFNGFGGGLNVGYNFMLNKQWMLGTEASWNYLGSFEDTGDDFQAAALFATATATITDKLDGILKVGFGREYISGDDTDNIARSDMAGIAAVGLAYNLDEHWDLNLQYTHIFGKSLTDILVYDSNSAISFNTYMVGVTYNFGNIS